MRANLSERVYFNHNYEIKVRDYSETKRFTGTTNTHHFAVYKVENNHSTYVTGGMSDSYEHAFKEAESSIPHTLVAYTPATQEMRH